MHTLKLNLTQEQAKRLYDAIANETAVKLAFSPSSFDNGTVPIKFTAAQVERLKQRKPISFSKNQVKKFQGSALPALIPLISMLLGGVGTAASVGTSIANTVNTKKSQDKQLAELMRHNKEVEGQLKGSGSRIHCLSCGSGFYLKPHGSGYYLKPFLG